MMWKRKRRAATAIAMMPMVYEDDDGDDYDDKSDNEKYNEEDDEKNTEKYNKKFCVYISYSSIYI